MNKATVFEVLDLTGVEPCRKAYPFYVVQQLIAATTGRFLFLEDHTEAKQALRNKLGKTVFSVNEYNDFFKLVHFPDPVGFVLVANKNIKAGSLICTYDGIPVDDEKAKSNSASADYLLSSSDPSLGREHTEDAQETGGLGALFAHLPSEEFSKDHFDVNQQSDIQTQNVYPIVFSHGRKKIIFFQAINDILAGTIIGFDYGPKYWPQKHQSPLYFKKGEPKLLGSIKVSNPDVVFVNPDSVNGLYLNRKNQNVAPFCLLSRLILHSREQLSTTVRTTRALTTPTLAVATDSAGESLLQTRAKESSTNPLEASPEAIVNICDASGEINLYFSMALLYHYLQSHCVAQDSENGLAIAATNAQPASRPCYNASHLFLPSCKNNVATAASAASACAA